MKSETTEMVEARDSITLTDDGKGGVRMKSDITAVVIFIICIVLLGMVEVYLIHLSAENALEIDMLGDKIVELEAKVEKLEAGKHEACLERAKEIMGVHGGE